MISGAAVNVLDFGADPTGGTDSTTAISNAIASVSNIGVVGGGSKIIFPKGTYLCHVSLQGTLNNSMGEYGICLSGYGATLKGRVTDTSIIQGNGAIATVVDPYPGGSIYINGTTIEGFTLDMSLMANAATSAAIAVDHMYNSTVRDIHVIGETGLSCGLSIGRQCYTWNTSNYGCSRIRIKGYDNANMTSALVFVDTIANQVILEDVFSISFFGGAIQGQQDHFVCTNNVQVLTVVGMDLEGDPSTSYTYRFGTNCRNIISIGNSCGGYSAATYSTGWAAACNLSDRPPISSYGGSLGTYAKIGSQGLVSVTATAATPIYYFYDAPPGQNCALVYTSGDNGLDGFQDLILVFGTVISVVSSNVLYGTPPTRTYTCPSNVLNLAVSAGSYNIRTVISEFLHN